MTKLISVRLEDDLLGELEALVGESAEYEDRSDAIRTLIRREVDRHTEDPDADVGELVPPQDDAVLRRAYEWLVRAQGPAGSVKQDRAEAALSQRVSVATDDVRRRVLVPLEERGYVAIRDPPPDQPGVEPVVVVHEHRRGGEQADD